MLLRLFVHMNVSAVSYLVCSIAICSAYNMLLEGWVHGSLVAMQFCNGSFKTLDYAMFPFPSMFGGVKQFVVRIICS